MAPGIFKRIIDFYNSKSRAEIIISVWIGFFLLVNYVFSLFGILIQVARKDKYTFLFILIILYFSILTGVVGVERYRMPFMPFINILCAFGFIHFYFKILTRLKTSQK